MLVRDLAAEHGAGPSVRSKPDTIRAEAAQARLGGRLGEGGQQGAKEPEPPASGDELAPRLSATRGHAVQRLWYKD